jgi:hypothetical protein
MGEMNEFQELVLTSAPAKLWAGEDVRPLALDAFEIRIEPGILEVEDEIILPGNLFAQVESL